MKRRSHRNLLFASVAVCGALFTCGAAAQDGCKLTPIVTAAVAAVQDGRTLLLADGRVLRLAGIEAGGDNATLQSIVAGNPLRLKTLGQDHDRYGRIVAFAFIADPRPPCSKRCSTRARRGCRPASATRAAPTRF